MPLSAVSAGPSLAQAFVAAAEVVGRVLDGESLNTALGDLKHRAPWQAVIAAAQDLCYNALRGYGVIDALRAAHPHGWEAALLDSNRHPPMVLRVNRRRLPASAYLEKLDRAAIPARALGEEAVLLEKPCRVERLPGFAAGEVSVQDAGAQRAAPLLDVRDGMRVLDACAAPGGKTGHLLELAQCELLAVEPGG